MPSKLQEYKNKKKIRRIEITPAENGFTTETSHEPTETYEKGSGMIGRYHEPEKTVHQSVGSVIAHVRQHLTRHAMNNFGKGK